MGRCPQWPAPAPEYREAVEHERRWLASPAFTAKLAAAAQALAGADLALEVPTDGMTEAEPARAVTLRQDLPPDLVAAVGRAAPDLDATPVMLYTAAFVALLARYTGRDDLVVALPFAGRDRPDVAGTYGLFVNTLPLRIGVRPDDTGAALVARVRDAALAAYGFADVPLDRLAAEVGGMPLQAMLVVQPGEEPLPDLPGIRAARYFAPCRHVKFGVVLQVDTGLLMHPGAEQPVHGTCVALEYPAVGFGVARAERMLTHWQQVLRALAERPTGQVADLDLSTPEEVALRAGNRRLARARPSVDPVAEFWRLAAEQPGLPAVHCRGQVVSYGALAVRAAALQAALQGAGVRPGDAVGVCLDRTPDLVAALLAILRCGAAYVPLDAAYPRERLAFIAGDARCALILTEPGTRGVLPPGVAPLLDVGTVGDRPDGEPPAAAVVNPEQTAYLIYTSGSTGRPKGVMIPHRAMRAFLGWAVVHFTRDDLALVLAGTSICFDLSVFELFAPLSTGGAIRLVDQALHLVEQPAPAPSLVNTVPSAMAELLRGGRLPAATRVVNLAGEVLPPALVDAVHAQSPSVRVFNLYGPSEDTTYSTWCEVPRGSTQEPTIGVPIDGTDAYVLGPDLASVPVGVDGELWLGGLGVALGYLDRPELTAERFRPDPFSGRPGARMYRTGDRVRLTETGELRYRGRYDHQVKLRGFRIEAGEIETRARAFDGVDQCVVSVRTVGGTPHLVCWWTGDADPNQLRDVLAAQLPEYMVPGFWVPLDVFPLNPNGKIDRDRLPEPSRDAGGTADLSTPTERVVAGLIAGLTGSGPLGAEADFFVLGGHSLLAMRFVVAVRARLGVEISLADVFAHRSVRALAARVDALLAGPTSLPPLRPRSGTGPVPLAFAQERMWLVEQLRPGSAMLNLGLAVRLVGDLDRGALRRALHALTDRHDALRLRIDRGADGQLRQQAMPSVPVVLPEVVAAQAEDTERVLRDAVATPFDVATEPPARWLLVDEPAGGDGCARAVLCLVIHHVIADARSLRVLLEQLLDDYAALRAGRPPAARTAPSVLDYAAWQRQQVDWSAITRRDLAFWEDQLAALPDRLQLPFDHAPATARSFTGARLTRRLPDDAVEGLLGVGRGAGVTPFTTLLAAYQALVGRLTGQDDVVVGTPIANRDRAGTESLVGCLLNTLALRADLSGAPSFAELLEQARQRCLAAFEHQQTPFELVLAGLDVERAVEHTPVFQTMFVLHVDRDPLPAPPGLSCRALDVEPVGTQYDLTLMISRDEQGWLAQWDYRTDLFEPGTVAGFADCFDVLLAAAVADPTMLLGQLPVATPQRQAELVALGSPAATPAPATLPRLFAVQVAAHPDRPALRDGAGTLTYRELDAATERLAARLAARGVGVEDRVALVLPRNRAWVTGMLAVAKAGAAFVSLDPALPAERMVWIARDAGVRLQLTDAALAGRLDPAVVPQLRVDVEAPQEPVASVDRSGLTTRSLAYVIYTSGSSGTPKGVLLTHHGLAQLLALHRDAFHVGPGSRVLQYAPYSFDACLWECVMGLLSGACLELVDAEALLPGAPLATTLAERGVTHLTIPPSNLAMLETLPDTVRHLVLAGEVLPGELVQRWGDRVHLWNAYGPTEATVCGTIKDCAGLPAEGAPTIGTAFPGAQALVLDDALNPVPPGVPGELCLGGQGVARGYLDRPELTAEKFVPHPYATGERLYRTGDRARLTAGGEIEFLGRVDDQVKLRGVRIELGEIERTLAGVDARIRDASALVVGSGADQRLVAFVAAPAGIDPAMLYDRLAARLPGSMVPAWVERLDSFPLTGNGKLDRRALAARATAHRPAARTAVPPRGPLEREVAAIWQDLLPEAEIGRHDSFFAIGGTSLTLTRLHERLDSRYRGALKLVDLFRLNTVAAIAASLRESGVAQRDEISDLSFRL